MNKIRSKHKFHFDRFLFNTRMSIAELAARLDLPYGTMYNMVRRAIVTNKFIGRLEKAFPSVNVNEYVGVVDVEAAPEDLNTGEMTSPPAPLLRKERGVLGDSEVAA